jgi:uncharacterized RDD family membrane protein YckC
MDSTALDPRQAHVAALRAEARFLSAAGLILLCAAFPMTLFFVAVVLAGAGASPMLPIAAGAPPIAIGYLACHFASRRQAKAKELAP